MRVLFVLLTFTLALAGCSGGQLLNGLASSSDHEMAANLIYDREHNLRADLYSPLKAQNAPVIVFFYGGRWTEGAKEDFRFVGQSLASKGYVTVIPDLRKYPDVRFPDFVTDAALAVRWTRDNIAQYGGSGQRLFVMGHSSGAHVAAMLALDERYLKAAGGSRTWLRGMIGLAGPYDFLPIVDPTLRDVFGPPDRFEQSQPIMFTDGRNPPLLLMASEDDRVVDIKNTRNLSRAVSKAGGPVETVIYPKMSHDLMLGSIGPVLRNRSDVLANIDSFVHRWADKPYSNNAALSIETRPLE